jgi:hypothetical protein
MSSVTDVYLIDLGGCAVPERPEIIAKIQSWLRQNERKELQQNGNIWTGEYRNFPDWDFSKMVKETCSAYPYFNYLLVMRYEQDWSPVIHHAPLPSGW